MNPRHNTALTHLPIEIPITQYTLFRTFCFDRHVGHHFGHFAFYKIGVWFRVVRVPNLYFGIQYSWGT